MRHRMNAEEFAGAVLALERAKQEVGPTRLADACGLAHSTVSGWSICPAPHCPKVEEMSGIDRRRLRPDVYRGM